MGVAIEALENQLNDFCLSEREAALTDLIEAWRQGALTLPDARDETNLHCHTFYSFNGYGYSPAALAWLGRRLGLRLMGIVDFDVLDGVDEFLAACDWVELRGIAGLETRVYIPEFSTREINSPGEPGIFYLMGVGFTGNTAPDGAADTLASMREAAEGRNRAMASRLNPYLAPVVADYDADVLPLTPKGNATERHMLVAYDEIARKAFPSKPELASFWSARLSISETEAIDLVDDTNALRDAIRSKLMKRGGVGYMAPTPEMFPRVPDVNRMIIACDAIPCATWLDGASAGEQCEEELLSLLIEQGVGVLNIIPDRNWNFPDKAQRDLKVSELYKVVDLAKEMDLPIIVGTEMNKFGQKLVDDFDSEALSPLRSVFMDGAYFVHGHTVLQRALGLGYQSTWAKTHLSSRRERNAFYMTAGKMIAPGIESLSKLRQLGMEHTPIKLLDRIRPS